MGKMKWIPITEHCFYFQGAANIGYIHDGDKGILIDAGLDKGTMKKVMKRLEEEKRPITHLFITHAHADHYGGAAYLQKQRDVYTVAPAFEEAILRNPLLEPVYLFQGTWPLKEMRTKFLEGEAIRIDKIATEGIWEFDGLSIECVALPGHSYYQLGYVIHDVAYIADAVFGIETLEKHKIPYIVDAEKTLQTLERLLSLRTKRAVVGHGQYEEDITELVKQNIAWHEMVLKSMEQTIERLKKLSHEQLIHEMCAYWGIELQSVSSWMLYRTAITAYLTKLIQDGKASISVRNHSLWIAGK
jgi:glyoxylase-like metal-dependent hydrolase (beta-lactamase superfamily II)